MAFGCCSQPTPEAAASGSLDLPMLLSGQGTQAGCLGSDRPEPRKEEPGALVICILMDYMVSDIAEVRTIHRQEGFEVPCLALHSLSH